MTDLTFITPIAPQHLPHFQQCRDSVLSQTIPALHLWAIDHDRRGAGYMRNRLLEQVTTPYVAFLDCDDWLEPTYAQVMIDALEYNVYTYCDWLQNGKVVQAPDCAWINKTAHLVTSVVPTEWVRELGGFDETLPAAEDSDFYVKIVTSGHYAKRVKVPLVHYRANGGRSQAAHDSGQIHDILALIQKRYEGKKVGCCGDEGQPDTTPVGDKQPHDVLAQAQWRGNHTERGRATGRHYPRTSYPHFVWVDPRDIAAAPQHWRVADTQPPPKASSPRNAVDALADKLIELGVWKNPPPPLPDVPPVIPLPNIKRVKRLAGAIKYPTFVAPFKYYPSYSDFWKLVELAGFERIHAHQLDLDNPEHTYIFVSPDGIPDCTGAKARCIFWQFEYQGDYTKQPNKDTCAEQWTSDPTDALTRGARFVLLGSHPYLNPTLDRNPESEWDLTLLGYMTDRRRVIKDQLSNYRWTPDYPGHDTDTRHEVLRGTRLMLHVHQHDTPALAPIRYALAAAYRLPVLVEMPDSFVFPYEGFVGATYAEIMGNASMFLSDPYYADFLERIGAVSYDQLCIQHPFDKCVLEAIEQSTRRTEVKQKNKGGRPRKVKK